MITEKKLQSAFENDQSHISLERKFECFVCQQNKSNPDSAWLGFKHVVLVLSMVHPFHT